MHKKKEAQQRCEKMYSQKSTEVKKKEAIFWETFN